MEDNTGCYVYRGIFSKSTVVWCKSHLTKNCYDIDLACKVEVLQSPETRSDHPDSVKKIETHFAWIFLCRHLVYQLKTPVHLQNLDFTSLKT